MALSTFFKKFFVKKKDVIMILYLVTVILCSCSLSAASSEWVPTPEFITSLNSTMDVVGQLTSEFSNLDAEKFYNDSGLDLATKQCVQLLQTSASQLNSSLTVSLKPNDDDFYGTGDLQSDIRTWLTAVLINQDTCLDGFEAANESVESFVENSLNKTTSLVKDLLKFLPQNPNIKLNGGRISINGNDNHFLSWVKDYGIFSSFLNHLPSWIGQDQVETLKTKRSGKDGERLQRRPRIERESSVPNVVVAADGTGNVTEIMDAVNRAPNNSKQRFVIQVKAGTYQEIVTISATKTNIMITGEGMDSTIITGNRSFGSGVTTYNSATFIVEGSGFIARDITFENTAGPSKRQAVALRVNNIAVFYRCGIRGYQDTLYLYSGRQFLKECTISGTVDFIFGRSLAVLQNCQILVRKGNPNQKMHTVTAHGGKDPKADNVEQGGFVFQFCNISPDSSYTPNSNSSTTYLGRPWSKFAITVFMQSFLSKIVSPQGWIEWNGNENSPDLYYAEYNNTGPGAQVEGRVKWPGYHPNINTIEAKKFTVSSFIDDGNWLRSTGVPFIGDRITQ